MIENKNYFHLQFVGVKSWFVPRDSSTTGNCQISGCGTLNTPKAENRLFLLELKM